MSKKYFVAPNEVISQTCYWQYKNFWFSHLLIILQWQRGSVFSSFTTLHLAYSWRKRQDN